MSTAQHQIRAAINAMSPVEMCIFCYDYLPHVYAALPPRATPPVVAAMLLAHATAPQHQAQVARWLGLLKTVNQTDKTEKEAVMSDEKGSTISIGNVGGNFTGKVSNRDIHHTENYTEGDSITVTGGTNVNIKSTLSQVNQTVGALPEGDARQELARLVAELESLLGHVPADKEPEAEAVAQTAEALVEQATAEKPNPVMVKITAEGLKQAAQNLVMVTPAIADISTKIVDAVMQLLEGS